MSWIGDIKDVIVLLLSWRDKKKLKEQEAIKIAEAEKQKNLKPAAIAINPEQRKKFKSLR